MKYFFAYNRKSQKAFTLVETLVAIAIVLIGVTAIFAAAQFGLSSTSKLRYRITAMYLAEEGLDVLKNQKDTNLLEGILSTPQGNVDWLRGIRNVCGAATPCGYDLTGDIYSKFINCAGADSCKVKEYTHPSTNTVLLRQMPGVGGVDTGFTRRIYVDERVYGKEAKVTVVITKTGMPDFRIESYIYNFWP